MITDSERYGEQVRLYGAGDDVHYKPFGILKIGYEDGTEVLPGVGLPEDEVFMTQDEIFSLISDDDHLVIDLNEEGYREAEKFFGTLVTEKRMEGVVINPWL